MAHLLQHKCYIHYVFLLKKTENSNSRCHKFFSSFFFCFLMCIDNTFYLTQEQIFYFNQLTTETEEIDGNPSFFKNLESFFIILRTQPGAEVLGDVICKISLIIIDMLW